MTSKRFPGKVLAPFLEKPILWHVVDRINKININVPIVLATSADTADDPLALYGKNLDLSVVRGPRDDVFSRFIQVLHKHPCDAFFRVCGDSPLLLSSLFPMAVEHFRRDDFDLVTNVFPRTFPLGMSVELVRASTFLEAENSIFAKDEREHVTRYFYQHSEKFSIYNMVCTNPKSPSLRLAVDELGDLKRIETWYLDHGEGYMEKFPVQDECSVSEVEKLAVGHRTSGLSPLTNQT